MTRPYIIKLSGHHIDEPVYLREFANIVAQLAVPVVIVHGGGKEITAMQEQQGLQPHYVDGVRVTDAQSLAIVTMVLCGAVNKRLVHYLNQAGVDALGLSGIDRKLIHAKKMPHPAVDMGYTGSVYSVRGDVLQALLDDGVVPVVAPVSGGDEHPYNVNGDHVTGAIAAALRATRLIYLSNIAGVMEDDRVLPHLNAAQARDLIANDIITGGMIPKVETALQALERGVGSVLITNLVGLKAERGTLLTAQ